MVLLAARAVVVAHCAVAPAVQTTVVQAVLVQRAAKAVTAVPAQAAMAAALWDW